MSSTPGDECMYRTTVRALVYNTHVSKAIETRKHSYYSNPIQDYDGDELTRYEHQEYCVKCKTGPNSLGTLLVKRHKH